MEVQTQKLCLFRAPTFFCFVLFLFLTCCYMDFMQFNKSVCENFFHCFFYTRYWVFFNFRHWNVLWNVHLFMLLKSKKPLRRLSAHNFFLSGISFTNIHKSQDCRGMGRHSLTSHYYFHPLYRNLDISLAITAESSPLHISSDRTRIGNHWFSSASR